MKKTRGVYEKMPGSDVYWIRYADASGRIRREKVGPKSAALKLYHKRKIEVLQGKSCQRHFGIGPFCSPKSQMMPWNTAILIIRGTSSMSKALAV